MFGVNRKRGKRKTHMQDQVLTYGFFGGRSEKTRTSGLLVPNQALYHLSHTPILFAL